MWVGTAILSNLILSQQSNPGGVTDVLRKLNIPPEYYCSVDNMYRSDAIKLQALQDEWINYVCENCQPYTTGGRILLSGDGVMKPKEGRYAPAVVRLHKESGTQSKPSSFHGIHVGALGIMALGQNHGVYCMPLFMQLMQGLDPVAKWEGSPYVHADMPLELQEIVYMAQAVRIFSCSAYYLTDRASMSANAFAKIAALIPITQLQGLEFTGGCAAGSCSQCSSAVSKSDFIGTGDLRRKLSANGEDVRAFSDHAHISVTKIL